MFIFAVRKSEINSWILITRTRKLTRNKKIGAAVLFYKKHYLILGKGSKSELRNILSKKGIGDDYLEQTTKTILKCGFEESLCYDRLYTCKIIELARKPVSELFDEVRFSLFYKKCLDVHILFSKDILGKLNKNNPKPGDLEPVVKYPSEFTIESAYCLIDKVSSYSKRFVNGEDLDKDLDPDGLQDEVEKLKAFAGVFVEDLIPQEEDLGMGL